MNWGYYIRQLREEAGLTQHQLAEKAGVKRSHISNIERGAYQTFRPELLEQFARGLDMPVKQIIDRIYSGTPEETSEKLEEILVTCVHNGKMYSGRIRRIS